MSFSLRAHSLLFISTLFLCLTACYSQQNVCRALVLEGGGDKGAYEVGVLSGWLNNTKNPEDFQYDVVTGISIGSINGMGMAQFPKGKEVEAVEFLLNNWQDTKRKNVYKQWPGGLIEGLVSKPSLLDNDAEIDYLNESIFTIPNQRKITVTTTDFKTGEKVTFTEQDWANNRTMAVYAALYSSAVPFIFKPRNYQNVTFIDGGWSGEALDVEDAVFRCRELVNNDDQIIIDVIFAQNATFTQEPANKFTTLDMHARYNALHQWVSNTRAYLYARASFPDVQFRYVMIASEKLPDQAIPLDFKAKNIKTMIELGIKDAKAALAEGPGVSAERFYNLAENYQNSLFFNGN
jgi:predicted acylesterase/phospholipase RssA